jgi:predicted nicotinamide N-methyase
LQANKTVLEIGAGLGLTGLLSHKLGAAEVVLSDNVPELVKCLQASADLTYADFYGGLGEANRVTKGIVRAELIDFEAEVIAARAEGQPTSHFSTYDVVVSSDVVYSEAHPVRLTVSIHQTVQFRHQ